MSTRRQIISGAGAGLIALAVDPIATFAADAETAEAIVMTFGKVPAREGRVEIKLPPLAESGNSVPLTVVIESPMNATDRVLRVAIFANRNPRPKVATMLFGPRAARAEFSTNIRLSGTQDVIALAEMSDHSLWKKQTRVLVTIGACDALQSRY